MNLPAFIKLTLIFVLASNAGLYADTLRYAVERSTDSNRTKSRMPGKRAEKALETPKEEVNDKKGSVTFKDGLTLVEGRLTVDPVSAARYFELVATSTPTAVSTKALIWLHNTGSTYSLNIIFPDGTIKSMATAP